MIKKAEILIVIILVLCEMTKATTVNISTVTDKESYLLGEEVVVSVIAYNPNPEPVTLTFSSRLNASYLMDDVYDWREFKTFLQIENSLTIEAYDSYTWELRHGSYEMGIYTLDVGTHTVVGEVVEYGYSVPVQFEVILEPATILLLALGSLFLTRRRR
jgi:hypothetical protein